MGVEMKWLFTLFSAALLSLSFLLLYSISPFSYPGQVFPSTVHRGPHYPPAFAYYIFGGRGQKDQILRLLLAVYHPRNRYLLHLAADASDDERRQLATEVNTVPAVRIFMNVDVIGKADRLSSMGASHIANTLHAASILLKVDSGWDWFITLSALDYPLITQDDLAHVFSSVRRDLNFIDHTSDLGWKEEQRIRPMVVDPGLYLARRTQIFRATQKRPTPDAFKIFTGSSWVTLSRQFLEHCVFGWDNLPRTLLMYVNNVMLSQECYFHSVACNTQDFMNTTVNSDLRFMIWDNPPKMEPLHLTSTDFDTMINSGSAFARQFHRNDPVLDLVDKRILNRVKGRVGPGGWCTGWDTWLIDPCSQWGDVNVLKPSSQSKKLEESILNLMEDVNGQLNQCR